MVRFSCIYSTLASAFLFLATHAVPLEPSVAPIEATPFAEIPSTSQKPDLPFAPPSKPLADESASPSGPFTLPITNFPMAQSVLPKTMASPIAELSVSLSPEPINEGCVAVEHLQGYALQHTHHFKRRVLCAEGFCATSNHAIIVDGEITSMKKLCAAKWSCVETEKLVNNLNMFVNRRAKITDRITVTPYDIRFPRWCVVIVQGIELLWNTASKSYILAAFTFISAIAVIQLQRKSKIE